MGSCVCLCMCMWKQYVDMGLSVVMREQVNYVDFSNFGYMTDFPLETLHRNK